MHLQNRTTGILVLCAVLLATVVVTHAQEGKITGRV